MKNRGTIVVVAAVLVGCQNESMARDSLEKDGYTDITLKKDKDGFTFTAKKKAETCEGTVSAKGFTSNFTTSTFASCKAVEHDCSAEFPDKCLDAALAVEKTDPAKAVELYQKGCDGKKAVCCANLGVAYENGSGVAKDTKKAFDLYQHACEAGNAIGCNNLGVAYRDAVGTTVDAKKAFDAFKKGCDGGDSTACTSLGAAIANGDGTDKDDAKAREAFKKACDAKDSMGCGNLGVFMVNAQGGSEDKAKGQELLSGACDHDVALACRNLSVLAGEKKILDPDAKQSSWAEKACKLDDGSGCVIIGNMQEKATAGVTKDLAKAMASYEKACKLQNSAGCFNVGIGHTQGWGGAPDMKLAGEAFDQSCKLGFAKGCDRAKAFPH